MSAIDDMKEHGITTTKAAYWAHLFPNLEMVFWYRVDHCREYVRLNKIPVTLARSKDGTPTGAGYLIRQDTYFISSAKVPSRYIDHVNDWSKLTDRELGLRGEAVLGALIEHRIIFFPLVRADSARDEASQYNSVDLMARYMPSLPDFKIELKTECLESGNLFVQIKERGHRTNLARDEDEIIERASNMPAFREP
jgi:hypothetical protein